MFQELAVFQNPDPPASNDVKVQFHELAMAKRTIFHYSASVSKLLREPAIEYFL